MRGWFAGRNWPVRPTRPAARWAALPAAVCLALTGCMAGHDFVPPEAPDVSGYLPGKSNSAAAKSAGIRIAIGAELPGAWWEMFRSKQLNALIVS